MTANYRAQARSLAHQFAEMDRMPEAVSAFEQALLSAHTAALEQAAKIAEDYPSVCLSCVDTKAVASEIRKAMPLPTEQAAKWQPIASAPQDGTPVLTIVKGTHSETKVPFLPMVAAYGRGMWRDPDECDECASLYEPTHWMPLPQPPTAAEQEVK